MMEDKYFIVLCLISVAHASLIQMRVVKETAHYGYFNNNADAESVHPLVASVPPSNFSGPLLMQRLLGRCYNLTLDRYRYTFCPFQNFTQYEVSPRWNAYQGILGIWSHWNIKNNIFAEMVLKNGDPCGDVDRSVKVSLECGSTEYLLNVTEPTRCEYSARFSTRFICHKDAQLVYPRLASELQKEWDELYTEYHYGYITEKGYELGLQKILAKADLAERPVMKRMQTTTPATSSGEDQTFGDLSSCNKQYKSLQDEVTKLNMELEALKLLLDINSIRNRTNKPRMAAPQ